MKTTKRQIKLKIKNTQKYGMGVFADEDIGQGEIVHVLSGERLKSSEMIRRILLDKEEINDPLQVGKRTYIDLDKLSRTFNHSCSPTVGISEDVLTTCGSIDLTATAVTNAGGIVLPVILALVNRSGLTEVSGKKIIALIDRPMPMWTPDECPLCKVGSEALRPKDNWAKLNAQ
jgi:hypothetical protein